MAHDAREHVHEADWYLVSDDGASALRLKDGLALGESEAGVIALNAPDAERRWISFAMGGGEGPRMEVISPHYRLRLDDGETALQFPLEPGATLRLPHNVLYISRDVSVGDQTGLVVEVEACPQAAPRETRAATRSDARSETGGEALGETGGEARSDFDGRARSEAAGRGEWRRELAAWVMLGAFFVLGTAVVWALTTYPALQSELDGLVAAAEEQLSRYAATPRDGISEDPVEAVASAEQRDSAVQPLVVDVPPRREIADGAASEATEQAGPEPGTTDEASATPDAATPVVGGQGGLDPRIHRARRLLEAGQITSPPGDNAVDVLSALVEEHPDNEQALWLLALCAQRLIEQAVTAREQGRTFEARNTLEEVLGFHPEHERANRLWQEWVGASREAR